MFRLTSVPPQVSELIPQCKKSQAFAAHNKPGNGKPETHQNCEEHN